MLDDVLGNYIYRRVFVSRAEPLQVTRGMSKDEFVLHMNHHSDDKQSLRLYLVSVERIHPQSMFLCIRPHSGIPFHTVKEDNTL